MEAGLLILIIHHGVRGDVESDMPLNCSYDTTSTTILSSREFNQHASAAKKQAQNGPVFITNRGRPAHVLLTMEDYKKITGTQSNILICLPCRQLMRLISIHPV